MPCVALLVTERRVRTRDPDVRVYVGTGSLVRAFAVYATADDGTVDVFWVTLDIGDFGAD